MLTQNYIPSPAPTSISPAFLTVADMLGCRIEYVSAKPYQRLPMTRIGIVIGYTHHKNTMYMKVQPECGLTRWVSEFDFVSYR